jgi:regulator of replication initiation timing
LETERKKREKSEKMAQQADVLRRERAVQETAIEMLGEDLENLTKERDNLSNQLTEMRNQFTDIVNENDHLHSEMSGMREQVSDSSLADELFVQMEDLRIKSERYER